MHLLAQLHFQEKEPQNNFVSQISVIHGFKSSHVIFSSVKVTWRDTNTKTLQKAQQSLPCEGSEFSPR